jgi:hypothetical protein
MFFTILWLLIAIVGILCILWRFNAYLWENEEIQMVFQELYVFYGFKLKYGGL